MDNKTLLDKLNELVINTNNGDNSGALNTINIQSELKINDDYTLYFFDDGDDLIISCCPVLVCGDIIFTPTDWQQWYNDWIDCDDTALADKIATTKWMDQEGIEAVIFDGLPTKIFDKA